MDIVLIMITLFCLPYAGGSAAIFNKWNSLVSREIRVVPVELAGRGGRMNEALYNTLNDAVDNVYNIIRKRIDNQQPYALFGHSMGALLAYKVVQRIRKEQLPEPIHIFFSGRGAPHSITRREKIYHTMEEEEFKRELLQLGGTPKEFFEHPELMEFLLPVLRNDFKLSETVLPVENIEPLDYDITVFVGKDEEGMVAEDVHGWRLHTKQLCIVHYFNGGHFFINDETERIVSIINEKLLSANKYSSK